MKRFIDYKIGLRLNALLSLTLLVLFSLLGFYIINKQKSKIISDTDVRMTEQVFDLEEIIKLEIDHNTKDIIKTRHLAEVISQLYLQNQTDDQPHTEIESLSKDNQFVDDVSALTNGAIISLFSIMPEGLIRSSTSFITDGNRNIGTIIPNESEITKTLQKMETFTGRAFISDDWYISSYSPIIDENKVIGALGVGIKEKDLPGLRKIFADKKYFETGYPFLIDSQGTFIIHPNKEGENASTAEFFTKMIAQKSNSGEIEYEWEGRKKYFTISTQLRLTPMSPFRFMKMS